MSLIKNTVTVGGLTLISRLFGYVRDVLIAGLLGASALNDAFIIAFRLPNLFRSIFGEGALSVSFVPKFNEMKASGGKKAKQFATSVQGILIIALLVAVVLATIFMPQIIMFMAPGYIDDPANFEIIVQLGRITFPYILLISLTAFYGGILNSFGKFFPFALAPVILNIVLIAACTIAYNSENPAHVLSYATIVAGVLELGFVLFFASKIGYALLPQKPAISDDVKVMFRRLGPGIMSAGVLQINIWVSTILASFYVGGNSFVYYADRIYQLPIALIGAALGTVVLPSLATHYATNDTKKAKDLIENACFLGLFFAIPSMIGISYLSYDLVEALFQRGQFDVNDTSNTASVLFIFAFGVPGYIVYKVFSSCFFAIGNTKFPFKAAIIATLVNVGVSLSLFNTLGLLAIPTGAIVSVYINVFILHKKLVKDKAFVLTVKMKKYVLKILISSLLMLIGLMSFEFWLDQTNQIVELFLKIFFAIVIYIMSAIMLKLANNRELMDIVKFKRKIG